MNLKITISVVAFFFSGQANALDCKASLSESERRICAEGSLRDLDEELNKTYDLAVGYVENKKALQLSQKSWIKKRDLCGTEQYKGRSYIYKCYQNAYETRIEQLTNMVLATKAQLKRNQIDYRVCQLIADLSDDNKLYAIKLKSHNVDMLVNAGAKFEAIAPSEITQINNLYPYRINKGDEYLQIHLGQDDGDVRFVSLPTGGTCPSQQIFNLGKLIQSDGKETGWEKVFDPQEELRWEFMGAEDSIIQFNSEYYVVTENIWGGDNLHLVSIIHDHGSIRPLCKIKETKAELVTVSSAHSDLCEQVANLTVKPLKGEQVINQKDSNSFAREVFNLDINNSGRGEKIGIFTNESGHGCGETMQKLQTFPPDLSAPTESTYNKKLEELTQWISYETKIQIYKIDGKYFALVNSDGRDGRSFDYFRLIELGDESVNTVCEFERKRHSQAVKIYHALD